MCRKFAISAALGAMLCFPVHVAAAPAPPISPSHPFTSAQIASMHSLIDRLAATTPLRRARIGVSIVQASTGRVLASREPDGEFAPASNFKLLDAASALAYLGPRYRFRTQLFARGAVDQGVLDGDLVFVGGGDPVLTRNDLRAAAMAVAAHGIQTITGSVVVDESFFDRQRYGSGWAWDDFPYYYQPPVQALAVEEGTADVTVTPGKSAGEPVAAQIEASGGAMTVVSHAITSPAHGLDDADCFRSPGATQIQIIGHVPVDAKPDVYKCAVDDSAAFAVGALRDLLQLAGVAVGSTPRGAAPDDGPLDIEDRGPLPASATSRYPDAALVWSHESPTVAALITTMMPPSDNFIAEHLFKALPTAAFHQRGSFDGGADVERKFIASLGLDPASIDNGDGSGLSEGDRITPRDITTILRWEWQGPYRDLYVYSLGRPGIDGTVRRHLVGTDSVGRVWAKDGYIWHVSTFSGYAFTRHHGLVVFSIMMNDADGPLAPSHAAQDVIVRTLVDLP
ncbi:MAG TPA: D-alanyl-D-alanine carboxypeptidase/D-alanyl-D-alanine-endopeptidase [Candidatus Eremiobacteraceae bacterium]